MLVRRMKALDRYILEKFQITKDSKLSHKDRLFANVNIKKWEWHSAYSSDGYQQKCKDDVKKFAKQYYETDESTALQSLFEDTYKEFIINSSVNGIKTNETYERTIDAMKRVCKSQGWSGFAYSYVPQGWWPFVYWVIKHNNDINENIK